MLRREEYTVKLHRKYPLWLTLEAASMRLIFPLRLSQAAMLFRSRPKLTTDKKKHCLIFQHPWEKTSFPPSFLLLLSRGRCWKNVVASKKEPSLFTCLLLIVWAIQTVTSYNQNKVSSREWNSAVAQQCMARCRCRCLSGFFICVLSWSSLKCCCFDYTRDLGSLPPQRNLWCCYVLINFKEI